MGSSGEDPNKGIDASVGGLVWVRRRNGSWWPGRILSPDELPEGCVPTPRAGTPVKLLGREDASVDWYNLEKSKRIKAFHCGEYEDCIEKAKAAATHLSKKGVKYARREDAILHALELENAHLGKDNSEISTAPDAQNGEQHNVYEPSAFHPSEENGNIDKDLNSPENGSDSAQEPSQSGVSFEEPEHVDLTKKEPKLRKTPNDSEDDGTGVKRMKGLEDLGMGVASSLKRKRSPVAHVHEFLKKKSRTRTLTKVLESTPALPVPPVEEKMSSPTESPAPIASDDKISELELNESKNSNGVLCKNGNVSGHANDAFLGSKHNGENSSKESVQRLLNALVVPEEKQSAGMPAILLDVSHKALIGSGAQHSSQSSHVENLSLGNEDHNESGSTTSGAGNVHPTNDKIEKGTSEWQLKGKRNSRSRKVDIDNEAETYPAVADEDSNHITHIETGIQQVKSRPITEFPVGWSRKETHTKGGSTLDLPVPQRTLPYRQSRFTVNPKYDSSDFSLSHHSTGSGMYDVTIKVKTAHKPQHVPYISLMSRFSGQPIVGHPVAVEVLADGSSYDLFTASEHQTKFDFNTTEDVVPVVKGSTRKSYKQKARGRPPRKHSSRYPRAKSSKSRRNSGNMSKKTRKLSTLTGSNRLIREQKKSKSVVEKLKGPSIACVPLKLIFSRINAALG